MARTSRISGSRQKRGRGKKGSSSPQSSVDWGTFSPLNCKKLNQIFFCFKRPSLRQCHDNFRKQTGHAQLGVWPTSPRSWEWKVGGEAVTFQPSTPVFYWLPLLPPILLPPPSTCLLIPLSPKVPGLQIHLILL